MNQQTKYLMEGVLNPDVDLVCGKCGCGSMLSFKPLIDGEVYVSCGNCGTLTGMDEIENGNIRVERIKNDFKACNIN